MSRNKTEFIGSFGTLAQLPPERLPEISFVGRSNVGKSSLINKLLGVRRLALTSSKPGKTRTINFFRVNEAIDFVDLPGYGFSKASKRERESWRKLIEGYLLGRGSLRLLVLLVDARHGPLANDRQMISWLSSHDIPFIMVLTKADKLNRNRQTLEKRKVADPEHELHGSVLCSAVTGTGIKTIWRCIEHAVSE